MDDCTLVGSVVKQRFQEKALALAECKRMDKELRENHVEVTINYLQTNASVKNTAKLAALLEGTSKG